MEYETASPLSVTPASGATSIPSWDLFRIWFSFGLASFGGGASTLFLIRRAAVEQYGWMTEAEFTRDYAVCQLTPGINILALTILIGRRCAGARGIILALAGLLLPSVTITIMLAATYSYIQQFAAVQAAVRGIIPATVGLGAILCWRMGQPLLRQSQREGRTALFVSSLILIGSPLVAFFFEPPIVLILLGAGAIGAIARLAMQRQ
jgi:chromate transporter